MNARMRFAGFLKMAVGAVAASSSSMKMSWERGGDFTMQPRRRTLALVKLPICLFLLVVPLLLGYGVPRALADSFTRSEEHTSELQSLAYLVCRLLLEKKTAHVFHRWHSLVPEDRRSRTSLSGSE